MLGAPIRFLSGREEVEALYVSYEKPPQELFDRHLLITDKRPWRVCVYGSNSSETRAALVDALKEWGIDPPNPG